MDNYRKHLGMWTETQQRSLGEAKVAVGGVGGVGSAEALLLAKSGVRRIRVADRDSYETENIVEQAFATWDVLGQRKVDVASIEMQRHQAGVQVDKIHGDLTDPALAATLVSGAGLLFSGVDNPHARVALGRVALREGIPFVVAANVGWSVFQTVYLPNHGGYAAAFESMEGITRDNLGFPVMSDDDTRDAVTRMWCIWTVAFSGFDRHSIGNFIRGDVGSYPYMAAPAYLAASLAVTDGIRHILGLGATSQYPQAQVIDLKQGRQLDEVEVQQRYQAIASVWGDGEEAVMATLDKEQQ